MRQVELCLAQFCRTTLRTLIVKLIGRQYRAVRSNSTIVQAGGQTGSEDGVVFDQCFEANWSLVRLVLLRCFRPLLSRVSIRCSGHYTVPVVRHWSIIDCWCCRDTDALALGFMARSGPVSASDCGSSLCPDGCLAGSRRYL